MSHVFWTQFAEIERDITAIVLLATLLLLVFVMQWPLLRRYDQDLLSRFHPALRARIFGFHRALIYSGAVVFKRVRRRSFEGYDFRDKIGFWFLPCYMIQMMAILGGVGMLLGIIFELLGYSK